MENIRIMDSKGAKQLNDVAPLNVDSVDKLIGKFEKFEAPFNGVKIVLDYYKHTKELIGNLGTKKSTKSKKVPQEKNLQAFGLKPLKMDELIEDGFTILNEDGSDHYHFLLCFRYLNDLYFFDPSGRGLDSIRKHSKENAKNSEDYKWDLGFIDAIRIPGLNIHITDTRLQRDYGSCGDFVVEIYRILQEDIKCRWGNMVSFNEYLKSYFFEVVTDKQLKMSGEESGEEKILFLQEFSMTERGVVSILPPELLFLCQSTGYIDSYISSFESESWSCSYRGNLNGRYSSLYVEKRDFEKKSVFIQNLENGDKETIETFKKEYEKRQESGSQIDRDLETVMQNYINKKPDCDKTIKEIKNRIGFLQKFENMSGEDIGYVNSYIKPLNEKIKT